MRKEITKFCSNTSKNTFNPDYTHSRNDDLISIDNVAKLYGVSVEEIHKRSLAGHMSSLWFLKEEIKYLLCERKSSKNQTCENAKYPLNPIDSND